MYITPILHLYFIIYLSSISPFFKTHAFYIMAGMGLYMTYITGILNVCTCAGLSYQYFYYEPWIFKIILVMDIYGIVD
jgi:hypothetical protein